MELTIRPMTPQERMYSYSQSSQIEGQAGCIGHLRGDLDSDGEAFLSSWTGHRDDLKTQDFKQNRKPVPLGSFAWIANGFPENKKPPFPTHRDEVNRGSTLIGCICNPLKNR